MHKVVVFGGTGFIGTALSNRLAEQKHQVTAFGRSRPAALNEEVAFAQGDYTSPADIERVLEGQEIVYHLVQGTPPPLVNFDIAGDLERTVIPTISLLQKCVAHRIQRLVFVSSGGTVYGEAGAGALSESSLPAPIAAYGAHKLLIENYLTVFARSQGLDSRVVRLSNPYGPLQDPSRGVGLVSTVISAMVGGRSVEIFGDGKNERDYVFIADAVEALVRLAAYQGAIRMFNVGSGLGHTILDVIAAIESASHLRARRIFLPSRPFDVGRNVLDVGLASRELNWSPSTSLKAGIAMTLRHFSEG